MNKFSLYILLILIFLGLSKGFSPSEQKTDYIINDRVLSHLFQEAPLSLMLLDTFQAGLLIKTYYLKLKIIKPFQVPHTIIVRTSKKFWKKIKAYKGMSIFRRKDQQLQKKPILESTTPLPPGSLYIGDPGYGTWVYADSGKKIWRFHKAYRNFSEVFHWGDFRPNFEFYKTMRIHQENNRPFFGFQNEFGEKGIVTLKQIQPMVDQTKVEKIQFKKHINKLILIPPWKTKRE